jgi:hypothetical protein
MKRFSEDELDAIQNKIFDSPFYGAFIILGLGASLYCGVMLWNL